MEKKHFQQQYEMNKKQHEIKENQKREQERLNALEKEKYSNYI
jgi:membrane protein involved in colicin uptake